VSTTGQRKFHKIGMKATVVVFLILPTILGACTGLFVYHKTEPRYKTTMTVRLASGGNASAAGSAAAEYLMGVMDSATLQATNLAVLQDDKLKAEMVDEQILAVPPVPEHFRGRSRNEIIDEVTAAISVTRKGDRTNLVLITVEGPVPDLLPDLASRFWNQFESMRSTIQSNLMDRGLAQAKKEMTQAKWARQEAETKLQDHLRRSNFSQTSFLTYRERLPEMESELRRQQDEVQTSLLPKAEMYQGVLTALEGEGDSGLVRFFDEDIVANDAEVRKLRKEIAAHESDLEELRGNLGFGPSDLRWKQYADVITGLEQDLHVLSREILVRFARDYRGKQKRQKDLLTQQSLLTREIAKFEEVARIYDRLQKDVDVARERDDVLAAAHDDILRAMGRAMADDNTGIVFAAPTPTEPFNLNLALTVSMGILFWLAIGPALCLALWILKLLQFIAPRVRVTEDLAPNEESTHGDSVRVAIGEMGEIVESDGAAEPESE
jgi:hypothetical protein